MKHSHTFPAIAMPPFWGDRITLARFNHALAPVYVRSIMDEAAKIAARCPGCPTGEETLCRDIVNECGWFLEMDPADYADQLDAIDALLVDEDADVIRLDEDARWASMTESYVPGRVGL